jgi:hypothetical protein
LESLGWITEYHGFRADRLEPVVLSYTSHMTEKHIYAQPRDDGMDGSASNLSWFPIELITDAE